jgi:hypothetical protein
MYMGVTVTVAAHADAKTIRAGAPAADKTAADHKGASGGVGGDEGSAGDESEKDIMAAEVAQKSGKSSKTGKGGKTGKNDNGDATVAAAVRVRAKGGRSGGKASPRPAAADDDAQSGHGGADGVNKKRVKGVKRAIDVGDDAHPFLRQGVMGTVSNVAAPRKRTYGKGGGNVKRASAAELQPPAPSADDMQVAVAAAERETLPVVLHVDGGGSRVQRRLVASDARYVSCHGAVSLRTLHTTLHAPTYVDLVASALAMMPHAGCSSCCCCCCCSDGLMRGGGVT